MSSVEVDVSMERAGGTEPRSPFAGALWRCSKRPATCVYTDTFGTSIQSVLCAHFGSHVEVDASLQLASNILLQLVWHRALRFNFFNVDTHRKVCGSSSISVLSSVTPAPHHDQSQQHQLWQ